MYDGQEEIDIFPTQPSEVYIESISWSVILFNNNLEFIDLSKPPE